MSYYLETIKTMPNGNSTAEIAKYPDELTARIFYHSSLNVNLRLVQNGELKAFYANIHNDSGVVSKQEREAIEEPAPEGGE